MKPKIINNFSANLTRYRNGDLNSGFARYDTTFGVNNFSQPGNLCFMESPISIGGSVVTDLIVAGKVRVESGITYVYAVGHLGRVYKIQVNDPTTHNPNYDTPVLLATLATNSPTFTMGGSLNFYGGKILIGHDVGVTSLTFNGVTEAFIGSAGTWVQSVPRPSALFNGNIYFGNGTNFAEVGSAFTVTTYTKISPALPTSMQVQDLDNTADGRYLVVTATEQAMTSILATTPNTNYIASGASLLAYWNGTDAGATSGTSIPSFSQTAYHTFEQKEFQFGYDLAGSIVSNPSQKLLSIVGGQSPMPNAVGSNGNLVGWMTPEFVNGFYNASLYLYGSLDLEVPTGFFRQLRMISSLSNGDILRVPMQILVSSFLFAPATGGYTAPFIGIGKSYFSTIEYNGSTTAYKLYSFSNVPVGLGSSLAGVYETQAELFSQKMAVKECRIYTEPAVANNQFQIDLIGSNGSVISGSTKSFTPSVGTDMVEFNPATAPSYAFGVRITNQGSVTPYIHKIELDIVPAGK